jgi:hypothetical protein
MHPVNMHVLLISDMHRNKAKRGLDMDFDGTVALSAIDAAAASGSALDECHNPVVYVSTAHSSTTI